MKKVLASFIAGILAGSAAVYYYFQRDVKAADEVVIRQVSGEKITHDDFNFKGSAITFKTTSDGAGVIETDIPKTLIPEAYNWMNRVHTVTVSLGFSSHGAPYYGVMYGYRIGRVTVGGGVDLSRDWMGAKIAIGYAW